jgi:putative membrane protein
MIDWSHWHNEPYLIGGLVLTGWLWAVLAGPLRRRFAPTDTPFPCAQAWSFYSALVVFYLAVGSPLDQIGERFLFSAHMLQHQLLIYPAAILFLIGLPHWMVDTVLRRPACLKLGRLLSQPVICAVVYTLVVSLWHMPTLYDWALQNKLIHVVEHVTFFGAALFYWWPSLSPSRVFPPITHGGQMLYMLAVLIGMTPVFAYITFSNDILYPTYEYAPRIFANFTAGEDQLLAGVAMKTVGLAVALTSFGVSFFRWSHATHAADTKT